MSGPGGDAPLDAYLKKRDSKLMAAVKAVELAKARVVVLEHREDVQPCVAWPSVPTKSVAAYHAALSDPQSTIEDRRRLRAVWRAEEREYLAQIVAYKRAELAEARLDLQLHDARAAYDDAQDRLDDVRWSP